MAENIIEIIALILISFHAVCVFLLRMEIKHLNELLTSVPPATVEKHKCRSVKRKTARFSDRSKKWLASKGKKDKEVD